MIDYYLNSQTMRTNEISGWLQARYTFSADTAFDPKNCWLPSLRVLNLRTLAPGASFQPRTTRKVDIYELEGKRNIVTVTATMCRQRPVKRC